MTDTPNERRAPAPTSGDGREPGPAVVGYATTAIAVLTAAPFVAQLVAEPASAFVVFDVAIGLLAVALVPVLFRRPVPTAVALAALAALSPLATPSATVATLYVARTRPLRTALWVAVAGAAAHIVRGIWRPLPDLPLAWWVLLVLVAHAALLGWGALAQSRQELICSLRERALRAEKDRDRLVREARAEERTRIAREMHDVLAHRLSLLATYAGALEFRPDAPPEQLARAAGVVRNGVHQALEDVREVVEVLRYEAPAGYRVPAQPQPDLGHLSDLVTEARDAGSSVELVDELDDPATGVIARTAYRIVQEGLTNARKHAPGCPVLLRVSGNEQDGLTVSVTNPLLQTPRKSELPGSSTGLLGLAERVRIVGGRFQHTAAGGEFRLHAWLPWQP